jgi:hypothetical protein
MSDVIVGLHRLICCPYGGLDGMLRDCLHDLGNNGSVDTDTSDSDAQPAAHVTVVAPAVVSMGVAGT